MKQENIKKYTLTRKELAEKLGIKGEIIYIGSTLQEITIEVKT